MPWRAQILSWNEGAVSGVLCENIFVAESLGTQLLFEILQPSLTVKNCENAVASGCFEKILQWGVPTLFRNEVK